MDKKRSKFFVMTPLVVHVVGGMILPLLLLLAAFSFMTFRRELQAEVTRCIHQSEIVLKSLQEQHLKMLSTSSIPPQNQSREELAQQMKFLKELYHFESIDLVQPMKQISLIDGRNLKEKKYALETEGLAKSLAAKRHGTPTYIESRLKIFSKQQAVYGYIPFRHKDIREPLVLITMFKTSLREVARQVFFSLGFMFVITLIVGLTIAIRLTHRIVRPIQAINKACREMLNGKLGLQVDVRTGDEIEVMAKNFNKMSQALMVMKRKAEDSNPLTQLPGNKQIMAELVRRIDDKRKFVYFHVDIDHFKAYNDTYGLGRGDDVLRRTADILKECASGAEGTFVGHQGGDDFVLITEPYLAQQLGQSVCQRFDALLKEFYEKETLERGYFTGVDARYEGFDESQAEIKRHAVMSISLAGISNMKAETTSYDEVLQGAVHVKKKAKKIPYSKALIEELRMAA